MDLLCLLMRFLSLESETLGIWCSSGFLWTIPAALHLRFECTQLFATLLTPHSPCLLSCTTYLALKVCFAKMRLDPLAYLRTSRQTGFCSLGMKGARFWRSVMFPILMSASWPLVFRLATLQLFVLHRCLRTKLGFGWCRALLRKLLLTIVWARTSHSQYYHFNWTALHRHWIWWRLSMCW